MSSESVPGGGEDELKRKVTRLQERLSETERDMHQAAQIGKELLTANNQLTEDHETERRGTAKKIEELEQEKYSLQLKLEQQRLMEKNYAEENEGLQRTVRQLKEDFDMFKQIEHEHKLTELKHQITGLREELERSNLSRQQQVEKVAALDKLLKESEDKIQLKATLANETCSEEMAQLISDLDALQADKSTLNRELCDVRSELGHLKLMVHALQEQLARKEQETEEEQRQATSYYNALEKCREEVLDLRVELDHALMENSDFKSKGNSLFSEVEDRRVDAEKKLITMKGEHQALKTRHEITQQQLHRLKVQMSSLLHMASGHADKDHVQHLEQQLAQARGEIHTLTDQLNSHEKQQKFSEEQMFEIQAAFNSQVDKNYADYVKELLKSKQKDMEKVKKELQSERMMRMAENDRVQETERQLYQSETLVAELQSKTMKMALKIEELRIKYEPDKMNANKRVRTKHLEVIPIPKKKEEEEKEKTKDAVKNVDLPISNVLPEESRIPLTAKCVVQSKKPLPQSKSELTSLQSKKKVKFIESEGEEEVSPQKKEKEGENVPIGVKKEAQGQKIKPQGRQKCHKVVKVPKAGEAPGECKQQ